VEPRDFERAEKGKHAGRKTIGDAGVKLLQECKETGIWRGLKPERGKEAVKRQRTTTSGTWGFY